MLEKKIKYKSFASSKMCEISVILGSHWVMNSLHVQTPNIENVYIPHSLISLLGRIRGQKEVPKVHFTQSSLLLKTLTGHFYDIWHSSMVLPPRKQKQTDMVITSSPANLKMDTEG